MFEPVSRGLSNPRRGHRLSAVRYKKKKKKKKKKKRKKKKEKKKKKKKKKGYKKKKGRKAEEEIDAEGITVIQIETWRDLAALNFYTRRPHKGTSFHFERALWDTTSEKGD